MAKRTRKKNRHNRTMRSLVILVCIAVLVFGAMYLLIWTQNRERIRKDAERYQAMYERAQSTQVPITTSEPTATPEPIMMEIAATIQPTEAPTEIPEQSMPKDAEIPTPNPETIVYALPTAPPVQGTFSALLEANPDTVGYLQVGDIIRLPVVQRLNDNDFYLTHSFDGNENAEGTLFMDGLNRLIPEDDCLIVYGHNMKNGTMFGDLKLFGSAETFRRTPLISFDTIYENRTYIPFAAFTASTDPNASGYFNVRKFLFDEESYNVFVYQLSTRSDVQVRLDMQYGDKLLLLVTCDTGRENGRLIVACRQLRGDESIDSVKTRLAQAQ